ncbi:MAG: lysylphosphatidylglycerol synthase transmembrane domain-containing protein [Acidimicrobiales bacterium]
MEPTTKDSRRTKVLLLRVGVSVAMLAFLFFTQFDDIDYSALVPRWSASTGFWLAGAAALTFAGIGISAARWQQVLTAMGIHSRWRHLMRVYLAGQFVSNVLPTTIGGDVVRVSRLSIETGQPPATFASVVLERLSGWIVLPLITFVGLAVNPGLRELGRASQYAALVAIATLVALVIVVILVANERLGGRFSHREGWTRFAGAVHLGVSRLRTRPSAALAIIGVGVVYQVVMVAAASMAGQALGISAVGFTSMLVFLPAVLILQVLPIGIAGLGIREGAFVLFLTPLGVPTEQAIGLGLLLFVLNVVTSLPGAPAFALGPRRRRAASEVSV